MQFTQIPMNSFFVPYTEPKTVLISPFLRIPALGAGARTHTDQTYVSFDRKQLLHVPGTSNCDIPCGAGAGRCATLFL